MGWLDKLFGKNNENGSPGAELHHRKYNEPPLSYVLPGLERVRIGRYTDNNKSLLQTEKWYEADSYFKEKNYIAAFNAFFTYLSDEGEQNVTYKQEGNGFSFTMIQGSKSIHGTCDGSIIQVTAALAVMDTPSTAVMRRLLEMNYSLYYSHSAMDADNKLCMVFLADVATTSPSKLYFGLKEIATKADRQDDLLIADFDTLRAADNDHIDPLSENELDIKYRFFKSWIEETLERVSSLNYDSFSGAIAYMLLTLIYRIDFLMQPEAILLTEIEKISTLYWNKKDEVPLIERNKLMKDAIAKLSALSREDFAKSVYNSKYTFSIAGAAKMDKVRENISGANNDSHWYIENKYPDIAVTITEYGLLYNQFIYSMPKVQTDLIAIFMSVIHPSFFNALGMKEVWYNKTDNSFDRVAITQAVNKIIAYYSHTYQKLKWNHAAISWNSLYDFCLSFSREISNLNLEIKRPS